VQLAVGGPLTGLAFGIATTVWLRYMYNNPTAEITLTVVSTYGTYLVADELFHVSAVLAVVVLGALWLFRHVISSLLYLSCCLITAVTCQPAWQLVPI
jgi:NhaP-type Na+/H+ or K+/H+ antiporter